MCKEYHGDLDHYRRCRRRKDIRMKIIEESYSKGLPLISLMGKRERNSGTIERVWPCRCYRSSIFSGSCVEEMPLLKTAKISTKTWSFLCPEVTCLYGGSLQCSLFKDHGSRYLLLWHTFPGNRDSETVGRYLTAVVEQYKYKSLISIEYYTQTIASIILSCVMMWQIALSSLLVVAISFVVSLVGDIVLKPLWKSCKTLSHSGHRISDHNSMIPWVRQ
jgi:hypothetical protein